MSKLSDFGASTPESAPEEEVKIQLSHWLETNDVSVFWEQSNRHGYDCFSTATAERPDLLAVGRHHTLAIEVKTPDGGGEVYDGAAQTVRYWRRFCFGDDSFRAAGAGHQPDAFVLATGLSPDGRFFERHGGRDQVRQCAIHERLNYWDPPIHFLPDWEFYTTEAITRMMWRFANATNSKHNSVPSAGIGSLLSGRLDGDQPRRKNTDEPAPFKGHTPPPKVLFKTYGDEHAGGAKCQNWRDV